MVGRSPFELLPPDQAQAGQAFAALAQAGAPFRDLRVQSFDAAGRVRHLEISGVPFFEADGRLGGFRGITRDVTDRVQGEAALRKSEARFRAVVENSNDGILFDDAEGVVHWRSPADARITGCTEEERVGRSGFSNIHPEDEPRARELWALALASQGEAIKGEYRILHKDGSVRWVEATAQSLLANPDVHAVIITRRDITGRREAEAALRASEARLRAVVENSNDGLLFLDRDGTVVWCSPCWLQISGHAAEERIGRSAVETVHPADRSMLRQVWQEVLASPATLHRVEYRIQHKDGSWRWMEAATQNLLDNPDLRAIVVAARDITERKRAEAERYRLEAQLRQAQKMEAVGQLAGGIAHDFNNILAAVTMQLNLLQLQPELAPCELQRELGELLEATSRASNLTRQLLLFSRRQPMKIARHELNAVVARLGAFLGRLLGEDVSFAVAHAAEPLWFDGDVGMIEQVVTNLCVNAREAMPRGGRLTISTEAVTLGGTAASELGASPGRFVRLQVDDSGTGIDEDALEHIFEPFYTTKAPGKGTGLGLAIVHGIVTTHGGLVRVESKPGEGSRFSVYLPAAPAPASGEAASAAARPAAASSACWWSRTSRGCGGSSCAA